MARDKDKEAKRRAKVIAKTAKRQARAKAKAAKGKGKHKHDDHGRTYTGHRWGKLYLFTTCSRCGKAVAKDKLEK